MKNVLNNPLTTKLIFCGGIIISLILIVRSFNYDRVGLLIGGFSLGSNIVYLLHEFTVRPLFDSYRRLLHKVVRDNEDLIKAWETSLDYETINTRYNSKAGKKSSSSN